VLDIGCHIGGQSLQIGAYYAPASVLGVDIDPLLISSAISNLHRTVNQAETKIEIANSDSA